MGKIITLALKDVRILFRDWPSLFFVFMFPLLIALFFGTIFSGGGSGDMSGMDIGVIDEDSSSYSQAFIDQISSSDALNVTPMTRSDANTKVRQGKLSAYVAIHKGFGATRGVFTDTAMLEVGVDPARQLEAGYLQGLLTRANFELLYKTYATPESWRGAIKDIQSDSSFMGSMDEDYRRLFNGSLDRLDSMAVKYMGEKQKDSAADSTASSKDPGFDLFAIDVHTVEDKGDSTASKPKHPRSSFEVTFPSAILWALIGCTATFAVSIVKERTAGTYLRLRLAPISRAQILAGKGLATFISSMSVCIMLILIGNLFFGVRIGDLLILLLGLVATALCFVGITMLISVTGKTEEAVGGFAWGILLLSAMTGGGMIPVIFMPKWLVAISYVSPVRWGILAIEGSIWRGFSFSEMMLPVGMLLGIGAVCFTIGVTILARFDR